VPDDLVGAVETGYRRFSDMIDNGDGLGTEAQLHEEAAVSGMLHTAVTKFGHTLQVSCSFEHLFTFQFTSSILPQFLHFLVFKLSLESRDCEYEHEKFYF